MNEFESFRFLVSTMFQHRWVGFPYIFTVELSSSSPKIPTNLEAQDFSRHRRRGTTRGKDSAGASLVTLLVSLSWLWWTGFCLNVETLFSIQKEFHRCGCGHRPKIGMVVATPGPLPGLHKTCSALLTEGLYHTSEERSFDRKGT